MAIHPYRPKPADCHATNLPMVLQRRNMPALRGESEPVQQGLWQIPQGVHRPDPWLFKSLFGNSAGSALGRQTAVCGVLDPQHIPEYASDLRPCIQPFAPPNPPASDFPNRLLAISLTRWCAFPLCAFGGTADKSNPPYRPAWPIPQQAAYQHTSIRLQYSDR